MRRAPVLYARTGKTKFSKRSAGACQISDKRKAGLAFLLIKVYRRSFAITAYPKNSAVFPWNNGLLSRWRTGNLMVKGVVKRKRKKGEWQKEERFVIENVYPELCGSANLKVDLILWTSASILCVTLIKKRQVCIVAVILYKTIVVKLVVFRRCCKFHLYYSQKTFTSIFYKLLSERHFLTSLCMISSKMDVDLRFFLIFDSRARSRHIDANREKKFYSLKYCKTFAETPTCCCNC